MARTGRDAAAELGVRLLCANRPGYGTSTPAASTMASVADDTAALLDAADLDRVVVLGMSVGGAYAAFAARHPDRVAALAVVAAPLEARTTMGGPDAEAERDRGLGARSAGQSRRLPPRRRPTARGLGLLTHRHPRAHPALVRRPRRPQPAQHGSMVGRTDHQCPTPPDTHHPPRDPARQLARHPPVVGRDSAQR
ncbi:alpha/beta fold hydrolase [uncultured Nocardioides sp.]|uniref:alpha/beta fold hydrolase n=1 Tax=uncultured Nocardioides sp. TaxID=198441 RepID=UPI00344FEBAE